MIDWRSISLQDLAGFIQCAVKPGHSWPGCKAQNQSLDL